MEEAEALTLVPCQFVRKFRHPQNNRTGDFAPPFLNGFAFFKRFSLNYGSGSLLRQEGFVNIPESTLI